MALLDQEPTAYEAVGDMTFCCPYQNAWTIRGKSSANICSNFSVNCFQFIRFIVSLR